MPHKDYEKRVATEAEHSENPGIKTGKEYWFVNTSDGKVFALDGKRKEMEVENVAWAFNVPDNAKKADLDDAKKIREAEAKNIISVISTTEIERIYVGQIAKSDREEKVGSQWVPGYNNGMEGEVRAAQLQKQGTIYSAEVTKYGQDKLATEHDKEEGQIKCAEQSKEGQIAITVGHGLKGDAKILFEAFEEFSKHNITRKELTDVDAALPKAAIQITKDGGAIITDDNGVSTKISPFER